MNKTYITFSFLIKKLNVSLITVKGDLNCC